MKKMLVLCALILFMCVFVPGVQAAPVALNELRNYGVQDTVVINGMSHNMKIGFMTTNEGVSGFACSGGYGLDWQYNVSDPADVLSYSQLEAIKLVIAAHDWLVADYTAGPWNSWSEDIHQVKWGVVAHLLILEIVHDGGITDFSALSTGNFQADIGNNWLWSNVANTYEAVVAGFIDFMLSGQVDGSGIAASALYTPAHNQGAISLLAFDPAGSAVPVPAAVWLLGTGAAGVALLHRRLA